MIVEYSNDTELIGDWSDIWTLGNMAFLNILSIKTEIYADVNQNDVEASLGLHICQS
jgi:hypothetical protein